jgi:hypothetical protein
MDHVAGQDERGDKEMGGLGAAGRRRAIGYSGFSEIKAPRMLPAKVVAQKR